MLNKVLLAAYLVAGIPFAFMMGIGAGFAGVSIGELVLSVLFAWLLWPIAAVALLFM